MKKRGIFGFLGILIGLFAVVQRVYAVTPEDIGQQLKDFYIGIFGPILTAIFGEGSSNYYVFEKFLIFFIILGVIYVVLNKFEVFSKNKAVHWIISLAIPLIAVRYLSFEQVSMIILQYQWLTIALSCIVPILIFFFFVYSVGEDHPILRKILWIFILAVYAGLYSSGGGKVDSSVYAYSMIVIIAFILLDNKIQKWFRFSKMRKSDKRWRMVMVAEIDDDIRKIQASSLPTSEKTKLIQEKEHEKVNLMKKTLYS